MGISEGKRVLVTGAASGIGRAIALLFCNEGASVALVDNNVAAGGATTSECRRSGSRAIFVPCDVTSSEDCLRSVRQTEKALGGLDVLINNAGAIIRRNVVELEEAEWDRTMDINVKSVFLMSKHAIPAMRLGGGGTIINISSGWGLVGGPRAAVYCAGKGAVVQLTKAMAIDHGPDNIRVNCICPGDTDTPMLRAEARQLGQDESQFITLAADRPLGRIGKPEEIAQTALFLAGDASSYMTGAVLVVDGGGLAGG